MPSPEENRAAIDEARAQQATTRRPTVAALEEVLFEPYQVLDHGFVRVVDYMGDDSAIVQAARVSYGTGTRHVSRDRGLIRYLMRHRHTSPFEMCEIKFHIKLPIFVARQWVRHRTANLNEYSARYSVLDKEFYVPDRAHLAAQSQANRQGRGATLEGAEAERVLHLLQRDAAQTYESYQEMLNADPDGGDEPRHPERKGLARELARMNLTVNYYTQWYWKIDLHNLLHFLYLRSDPHAQYEIRAYAQVMLDMVKRWVPIAAQAFEDYVTQGAQFSRQMVDVLNRMLDGEAVTQEESGLSPREWKELMAALGREG